MREPKKNPVPKWLGELQQRSWEPEILLSGIVLYGMFKVPDLLDEFLVYFKLNIFGSSQDINNLIALFKMGIYWLISGLIMHLICRGIWIGIVGLSYTFPKGVRVEQLRYKGKFLDKARRIPSFQDIVINLEKISSSLFSVSFMLFMSLIGGYFFFLILIILPFTLLYLYFDLGFSGPQFDAFKAYMMIILTIGVVGLIDFISLGYFRRFTFFAKVYWPFHYFISRLTLARFYRAIYYGLVSNFNKLTFFLILTFFILISLFGAASMVNSQYPGDRYSQISLWDTPIGYSTFSGYYDDQNQEHPSVKAHIPSDVITGNVLKLFAVANVSYEKEMLERTSLDSLKIIYPDATDNALELKVVSAFFKVFINGKHVPISKWYFHYKTHLSQRGYLTYIDISTLSQGMHEVELRGSGQSHNYALAIIPFYKDTIEKSASNQEDN